MHAMDGETDRRMDKSNAYWPFPYGWGHNKATNILQNIHEMKLLLVQNNIGILTCDLHFMIR